MFEIPTAQEFYSATLKANGFTPPEDTLEKVAAAQGINIETAKLANAFFTQMQLDGVDADPKTLLDDAMKMASAYLDLCQEQAKGAEKLAGELHKVAMRAMEDFLTHNRIELDANEAVKIAGLQAQSFLELTKREATFRQAESKVASLKMAEGFKISAYNNLGTASPQTAGNLNIDETYRSMAEGYGADPAHLRAYVGAHVGPEHEREFLHGMVQAANQGHGKGGFPELVSHVHANGPAGAAPGAPAAAGAKPAGGLMSRPGALLGAGALGMGALYMMKKRREAPDQAAANRAGAIGNTAGLPAA